MLGALGVKLSLVDKLSYYFLSKTQTINDVWEKTSFQSYDISGKEIVWVVTYVAFLS